MNIFEILGPVMIGPSSSHTAGVVRAGNVSARLLGKPVCNAVITLYGSFAKTYFGHGTDCAVLGGLMGFLPDDPRIPNTHELAKEAGINYRFELNSDESVLHPNTVKLELTASDRSFISVRVQSLGGGAINVCGIDDAEVSFTTEYHTTVIMNEDKSGVVADVSSVFARCSVNIAFMRLFRLNKSAIMVIESDDPMPASAGVELSKVRHVTRVIDIPSFVK